MRGLSVPAGEPDGGEKALTRHGSFIGVCRRWSLATSSSTFKIRHRLKLRGVIDWFTLPVWQWEQIIEAMLTSSLKI